MINPITKVKIFIVEDEILIAQDIANRLKDMGYEIVGTAPSAVKAIQHITENQNIDIVLIDIILKGELDGIELAQIIQKKYKIPFIFLTAHANTDLVERAKNTNPHGYILKPFNDHQISITIEVSIANHKSKTEEVNTLENMQSTSFLNTTLEIKDSLFLRKDRHFERVPLKDIQFLKADDNYCTVYTKSEKFIYSMVLKKLETHLPVNQFLRVHRSYVVNIASINGFEGNMLFIGNRKIPVSKTYKNAVFKLFHSI